MNSLCLQYAVFIAAFHHLARIEGRQPDVAVYEAKENYEKAYKINPKYEDLPERLSVISIMTDDLDGFLKYNKDCERPFREETIQQLLNGPDHRKEDEPILKEIMKRLKEEKENNKSN